MSIQKCKLSAVAVEVCVDVILLGNRREFAVVKEPDGPDRTGEGANANLVAGTSRIDMQV